MSFHHPSTARILGFLAPAGVRLTREEKKDKNILAVMLRYGFAVFGIESESASGLAEKIGALGPQSRRLHCRAYRVGRVATHGLTGQDAGELNDRRSNQITFKAAKKSAKAGRLRGRRAFAHAAPEGPSERDIQNFYASWEWKRLSYDAKLERGRRCECCGARAPDVRINTDHIKPIRWHWHLRFERSNLQVMCADCNMGKGSRDETDFRAPPAPNHSNCAIFGTATTLPSLNGKVTRLELAPVNAELDT